MSAKPWLRDYFKRLVENIERNDILNERALSATVELPLPGWAKGRTLLQALEYDKDYVQQQYPIQIGTSKPRVDFLLGRDANRWMLDLKRPGEACDRPKYVGQLQSYLGQEKVALGVLFNGTWALAYINPDHVFVADLCKAVTEKDINQIPELDLRNTPVIKARMSLGNTRELVEFFGMLRCDGELPDIKALARKLTATHIKRVQSEARSISRTTEISATVIEMLHNPSEQFIEAMIATSSELLRLRVRSKEVLDIWQTNLIESSKKNDGQTKTFPIIK